MSDARDVMRETLMNARQCRKACYEVRSCDCAQDVVKILASLAEAGLEIRKSVDLTKHYSWCCLVDTECNCGGREGSE